MEKYNLGLIDHEPKTLEQLGIVLEFATVLDLEEYKKIRCEAIDQDPVAFNMTSKREALKKKNRPDKEWIMELVKSRVLLAKHKSGPVGVIRITYNKDGTWSVNNVYVTPAFRKKITGGSISEEMFNKIFNEIKSQGGNKARLWVKDSSINALKLYQSLGFKKINLKKSLSLVGSRPDLLIGWNIMEKDLTTQEGKV